jgi:hypothetical protein
VGGMGCFRGKTGGEIGVATVGRCLLVEVNIQGVWRRVGKRGGERG